MCKRGETMEQSILTHLGVKVTRQRKTIITILERNPEPVTAEEIYQQIGKEEKINFSTVYRTLSTLSEKGAVIKTGAPGGKTYYQLRRSTHEHELECLSCHKHIVIETCPVESISRTLNEETGFVITEHNLQIKGLCSDCAEQRR